MSLDYGATWYPHAKPSITVMPHIQDGEGGWYVIIGGQEVAGPFSEAEASATLGRILQG